MRRTLAALLLLTLGCGGQGKDPAPALLFPSASALPDSFAVRNDSLDFHAVPRSGALWMTRPIADWADVQRTGSLLQIARAGFAVRVVAESVEDWSEYGLEPPRATVTIDRETLAIGNPNVTGDGVYARSPADDPRLILIGNPFRSFATLRTEQLRDRHPLRFPIRDLQGIRIQDARTTRTATRNVERWTVVESDVRADGRAIWRIAFHLLDGTIHSFADAGTELPDTTLAIELAWKGGGSGRVSFGDSLPGTALVSAASSDRPGVFYWPERLLDSLLVHARPFFERRLLPAAGLGADEVEITNEGRSVRIVRSEDGWRRESASGPALPGPAVRAFLRNLEKATIEGVVPRPIAEKSRDARWSIRVDDETVRIDDADRGIVFIRRDGEAGTLSLAPEQWDALRALADDLLDR